MNAVSAGPSGDQEANVRRAQERLNMAWQAFARCKGVPAEVFYPLTDEEAEEPKAICAKCPVREACLEYAIAAREKDGVWGGLTDRERRRLIRRRRRSA